MSFQSSVQLIAREVLLTACRNFSLWEKEGDHQMARNIILLLCSDTMQCLTGILLHIWRHLYKNDQCKNVASFRNSQNVHSLRRPRHSFLAVIAETHSYSSLSHLIALTKMKYIHHQLRLKFNESLIKNITDPWIPAWSLKDNPDSSIWSVIRAPWRRRERIWSFPREAQWPKATAAY